MRPRTGLEPAQDGDSVLHRRLADEDLLEPALQRRVLLDPLPELVQRVAPTIRSSPRPAWA